MGWVLWHINHFKLFNAYTNLFLRRKKKRTMCRKRESNLRQCSNKTLLSLFVKNYYSDPQYEFGDRTVKVRKISASKWISSLASWMEFPLEIKVKLNERWQLKFYQVKQLEENSTKNSAKKNLKEDSKYKWTLKHFYKTKKKEKYSNSKELFPGPSLR